MAEPSQTEKIKEAGAPDEAAIAAGLPSKREQEAAAAEARKADRFPLERLLGADGPAIIRGCYDAGDEVPVGADTAAAIGGAFLSADDDAEYTRAQVRAKVEAFLEHRDTSLPEDEEE